MGGSARIVERAVEGLLAGLIGCQGVGGGASPVVSVPPAAKPEPAEPESEPPRARVAKAADAGEPNCCKGKNECKGKGNCKVEMSHDCKGQNDCKGKGGCKSIDCVDGPAAPEP